MVSHCCHVNQALDQSAERGSIFELNTRKDQQIIDTIIEEESSSDSSDYQFDSPNKKYEEIQQKKVLKSGRDKDVIRKSEFIKSAIK